MPVTPYFDDCSFVVSFETRKSEPSSIVLSKIVLAIQGPLRFHMNFRVGVAVSAKKVSEILISVILNL